MVFVVVCLLCFWWWFWWWFGLCGFWLVWVVVLRIFKRFLWWCVCVFWSASELLSAGVAVGWSQASNIGKISAEPEGPKCETVSHFRVLSGEPTCFFWGVAPDFCPANPPSWVVFSGEPTESRLDPANLA